MSKDSLESIAYENGLQYIETTTGVNGYPQHIRGAVIGFTTFTEAELLAKEYGLCIRTFFKRDGWQLYQREGWNTYRPLHITASDYGDDYNQLDVSDCRDFFENEVKPFLEDMESFEDLKKFIAGKEELLEKLEDIDDGQIVITRCGDYYETIDKGLMEWDHDSKTWVIGVMEDEA